MLKREEGFTLIELLVTITFVGIIMIVMTLSITDSVKVGKLADRRYQALNLASMILEDLHNNAFASLTGTFSYTLSDGYTGQVQVTDQQLDDEGQPLLKEIIVTVTWSEDDQVNQVQLTTYRAKVLF